MRGGKLVIIELCVVVLALGCHKSATKTSAKASAGGSAKANTKAPAAKTAEVNPCTVLTEKMVRSAVGLAPSIKVTQRHSNTLHEACFYQWKNPDYDPMKAMRQAGAQLAKGKKGKLGPGAMSPVFQVEYIPGSTWPDTAAAQKAFKTSQRQLPGHDSGKVAVSGVGDEAMWTASSRHLSWRDKMQLSFIVVRLGKPDATQLDVAKKLALDVTAARK